MRISIVRATTIIPIIAAIEKLNMSPTRLLEDACLPQPECYAANDWVSTDRILHLADRVKRKAGVASFAHLAAAAGAISDMGAFGKHLLQSPTLNQVLRRYCNDHGFHRNSSAFYVDVGRNTAWFRRKPRGRVALGQDELELYALSEMLKVPRLALGPNWWPERIYVQSDHAPGLQEEAEEAGTELCFGQNFSGFAIPLSSLPLPPRHIHKPIGTDYFPASSDESWSPAPDDFVGCLEKILPSYMRDGEISIETTGEILGLSVRALQRQLVRRKLCYRTLLDQIRFQSASELLKQNEVKLIEIAIDLGYGHAASFSRAFHRWAGISPRQFRDQSLRQY